MQLSVFQLYTFPLFKLTPIYKSSTICTAIECLHSHTETCLPAVGDHSRRWFICLLSFVHDNMAQQAAGESSIWAFPSAGFREASRLEATKKRQVERDRSDIQVFSVWHFEIFGGVNALFLCSLASLRTWTKLTNNSGMVWYLHAHIWWTKVD